MKAIHKITGDGRGGQIYWTLCGRKWQEPVKGTFMDHKVTCKNCLRVLRGKGK